MMQQTKQKKCAQLLCMLTAFLSLVIMTGCKDNDVPLVGHPSSRGFLHFGPTLITEYCEFSAIKQSEEVNDYRDILINESVGPRVWEMTGNNGNGPEILIPDVDTLSYPKKGFFRKLSQMNHDTGFKPGVPDYDIYCIYHNTDMQGAWIEDIINVQVTAKSDYNQSHPAGSDLSEVAYLSYITTYPYIQEGYLFNENSIGNGFHPSITGYGQESCYIGGNLELRNHIKVKDITKNPLKMVGCFARLSLIEPPEQQCEIEIAITVQLRTGEYPARTLKAVYTVGAETIPI